MAAVRARRGRPDGFDWSQWTTQNVDLDNMFGSDSGNLGDFSDFFASIFGSAGGGTRTRTTRRGPARGAIWNNDRDRAARGLSGRNAHAANDRPNARSESAAGREDGFQNPRERQGGAGRSAARRAIYS